MQNFVITLLICSVTMSMLALLYMVSTPVLAKHYSEKGRYYAWLIIVAGLVIPFRPQLGNSLFSVAMPAPVEPLSNLQSVGVMPVNEPLMLANTSSISFSWWQIALAIWIIGFMSFVLYQGIMHVRFINMVRRWGTEITDENILYMLKSIKYEMRIKKEISVHLCPLVGSPMMIGLLNPKILLPTIKLSQDELSLILKHELVHYKRKDLLYKYLVLLATALHWFNPLVYVMAKAVSIQCETSCDAEVLKSADYKMRQCYGETIIDMVKYQSKLKTALSTNFYGGKNNMKARILSITDTRKKKAGAILICLALMLAMGTGLVFAVETAPFSGNVIIEKHYDEDGNLVKEAWGASGYELCKYELAEMRELKGTVRVRVTPTEFTDIPDLLSGEVTTSITVSEHIISDEGHFMRFELDENGRVMIDGFNDEFPRSFVISVFDGETGKLFEIDEYGNKTERVLSPEEIEEMTSRAILVEGYRVE